MREQSSLTVQFDHTRVCWTYGVLGRHVAIAHSDIMHYTHEESVPLIHAIASMISCHSFIVSANTRAVAAIEMRSLVAFRLSHSGSTMPYLAHVAREGN